MCRSKTMCSSLSTLLALYMFLVYASAGFLFKATFEIVVAAIILLQCGFITTKAHQSAEKVRRLPEWAQRSDLPTCVHFSFELRSR